jgi:hypothetical protein
MLIIIHGPITNHFIILSNQVIFIVFSSIIKVEKTECENENISLNIIDEDTNFFSFLFFMYTGLSIGFGVLSENDDVTRLFTTLHVLSGAFCITVLLSLLSEKALANLENKVKMSELNRLIMNTATTRNPKHSSLQHYQDQPLYLKLLSGCITIEVITALFWLILGMITPFLFIFTSWSTVLIV